MQLGSLIQSFFTTGGPGGVFVLIVFSGALLTYFGLTRWIIRGSRADRLREKRAGSHDSHAPGTGEGGKQ